MKTFFHLAARIVVITCSFLSMQKFSTAQNLDPQYRPLKIPRQTGGIVQKIRRSTTPESFPVLYTQNVHADTAAFTLFATLRGVMAGNASWIDFDNDGDLDVFVSGWDDTNVVSIMYRNDGDAFVDVNANIIGTATEQAVDWGDFDNDGDFDLAFSGTLDTMNRETVAKVYRNDGGTFVDVGAGLHGVIGSTTTWVDYDLDGRLDLLVCGSSDNGSTFSSKLYHNESRNDTAIFTPNPQYLPGVWGSSADWGDYDNDGDPDLLLTGYGDWGVTVGLFRNDSGSFTYVPSSLQPVNHSKVVWGDYDNDGYQDILLSGDPPGDDNNFTALYHNQGDGTFARVPTDLPQINLTGAAWGDYDNDGDLDLAINGWLNDSTNITKIFRNDGGGVFTDIHADLPGTFWGSIAWGDVDNDGRLDLLFCGSTIPLPYIYRYCCYHGPVLPITVIYHNNTVPANQKPSVPTGLSAATSASGVHLSWDKATDDRTPQRSLTYNIRVGTTPGGHDVVAPSSNFATGFRRIPTVGNTNRVTSRTIDHLSPGTYYWSVQSVDNSYGGSPFSSEGVVELSQGQQWQLISLPYTYSDRHKSVLFPDAVSNAFSYQGSGYATSDELDNGYGYWLKFATSTLPAPLSGGTMTSLTVPVTQGWNLIGSISQQISAAQITSEPPGMITSQFFHYNGTYVTSDVVEPGKGYWVKVNQSGSLTLSASSNAEAANAGIKIVPIAQRPPSPPDDQGEGRVHVPTSYMLKQNYPNPFNPSTRIQFALPERASVTLKVYSVFGQEIAELIHNDLMDEGIREVTFDASKLSSGVYYYRIVAKSVSENGPPNHAGTFTSVRKMLLLK